MPGRCALSVQTPFAMSPSKRGVNLRPSGYQLRAGWARKHSECSTEEHCVSLHKPRATLTAKFTGQTVCCFQVFGGRREWASRLLEVSSRSWGWGLWSACVPLLMGVLYILEWGWEARGPDVGSEGKQGQGPLGGVRRLTQPPHHSQRGPGAEACVPHGRFCPVPPCSCVPPAHSVSAADIRSPFQRGMLPQNLPSTHFPKHPPSELIAELAQGWQDGPVGRELATQA